MDKLVIGLFADILYIKGILNIEEVEALYDMENATDINSFIDKLFRGEFHGNKKATTPYDWYTE